MTALNPLLTVGRQIAEMVLLHEGVSRRAANARAVEMLHRVRIPAPKQRAREYAHQMSGGMRQRAMIAMALACKPKVLLADEPTTALDVTIQAQVLDLIGDLRRELGTAVVLITHDLGVVAETADRMIVMYAGRKVEEGLTKDLFTDPCHPYLQGLLASVPRFGGAEGTRLREIPGIVPPLSNLPKGCAFAPRCTAAIDTCRDSVPPLEWKRPGHAAACWVT
jgi:peptide/nickel transport system ATP-binding protein